MLLLGIDPVCKYLMSNGVDQLDIKYKAVNLKIEKIAYELFEMRIEDIICKLTDIEINLEMHISSRPNIQEKTVEVKQYLYNKARLARIEAKIHLASVYYNMLQSNTIDECIDICILRYIKGEVVRRHTEWIYNRT